MPPDNSPTGSASSASIDAEVNRPVAIEGELAQAVRAREDGEIGHASAVADLEARLFDLETALGTSRHERESSVAEVERLSAREAELDAALAAVRASHGDSERRLAATEAAVRDADARATHKRMAATRKAAGRRQSSTGRCATSARREPMSEREVEAAQEAARGSARLPLPPNSLSIRRRFDRSCRKPRPIATV